MRRPIATFLTAIFLCCSVTFAATEPKRILLIGSYGRDFEPFSFFVAALRTELARKSQVPPEIYEASFATARFVEGERDAPFIGYLKSLFDERRLDLVITIGGPATRFVQRHRAAVFPTVPVLFSGVDQRRFDMKALTALDAAVAFKVDRSAMVASILKLLPVTKHIAIVIGGTPNARLWLDELRAEMQHFGNRVEFIWLSNLPLDELKSQLSGLPAQSAILLGPSASDKNEVGSLLEALHGVANAPIFGTFDSYLGKGIVGGSLISLDNIGRDAAAAAVRILQGESPQNIKIAPVEAVTPIFDWRELQRWGIAEASLPPGSIVRFREPAIWQQYQSQIISIAALCAFEALLIGLLLVNRHSREHAEMEARELSGRLINAYEEERSRIARELHDDVSQRLAMLAVQANSAEIKTGDADSDSAIRSVREGLIGLSQDVHALSYHLHPSILKDLGLEEALRSECDQFQKVCPIELHVSLGDSSDKLSYDSALCLLRIAQEGLRNISRHAKATRVEVNLRRLQAGIELTIMDNGVGFDTKDRKPKASLGHAGMRQRISLVGGRLAILSKRNRGTTIRTWVPLAEKKSEAA